MVEYLTIRAFPAFYVPSSEAASDKLQPTYLDNLSFFHLFFSSVQQIFCELAGFWWLGQSFWRMASVELLAGRDPWRFLDSVKSYLQWRIASSRKRSTSWRSQPAEVHAIVHAVNIVNQLLSIDLSDCDERRQIFSDLGRELEAAKLAHRRASLPPKKPVQSVKLNVEPVRISYDKVPK